MINTKEIPETVIAFTGCVNFLHPGRIALDGSRGYSYMGWRAIPGYDKYDALFSGKIRLVRSGTRIIPFDGDDGNLYVKLQNNRGTEVTCLLADIMLNTFQSDFYRTGLKINFRDGDRKNCNINNLTFKFPKMPGGASAIEDDDFTLGYWRCQSKADSVNNRIGGNGRVDKFDILRILKLHEFKCLYCRVLLSPRSWQVDHFLPISKGGSSLIQNLVPACKICNMMKGDLFFEQFIKHVRMIAKECNHDKSKSLYKDG